MSRIQAQSARVKPWVVLDFICDHCGKKLEAVVIANGGTEKRILKSYHDKCWTEHILPQQKLVRLGEN